MKENIKLSNYRYLLDTQQEQSVDRFGKNENDFSYKAWKPYQYMQEDESGQRTYS